MFIIIIHTCTLRNYMGVTKSMHLLAIQAHGMDDNSFQIIVRRKKVIPHHNAQKEV